MIFEVPAIAVFTKFDQFKRDIKIKLEDQGHDVTNLNEEVERIFGEHYQAGLRGSRLFVCLESEDFSLCTEVYCANLCPAGMHITGERCNALIEMTASALSGEAVALMLVAAQKSGLELSINQAVRRYVLG